MRGRRVKLNIMLYFVCDLFGRVTLRVCVCLLRVCVFVCVYLLCVSLPAVYHKVGRLVV